METTEFKATMVFITIVLIAIVIELPARLIKYFFQNPKDDTIDHLGNQEKKNDEPESDVYPSVAWTEQTVWYPPKIKPVRDGVYHVRWSTSSGIPVLHYACWRNQSWGMISSTIEGAEKLKHGNNCAAQDFQWRGVTYDKQ